MLNRWVERWICNQLYIHIDLFLFFWIVIEIYRLWIEKKLEADPRFFLMGVGKSSYDVYKAERVPNVFCIVTNIQWQKKRSLFVKHIYGSITTFIMHCVGILWISTRLSHQQKYAFVSLVVVTYYSNKHIKNACLRKFYNKLMTRHWFHGKSVIETSII